jgi:hypothetical protein
LLPKPILFEIKTKTSASDVQKGLGQLLLYEKILEREVRKILLLPSMPKASIVAYLKESDVDVLTHGSRGKRSKFSSLESLFKSAIVPRT